MRRCYETQWRFDPTSTITNPAKWYFALPGAPLFTLATPFRSQLYRGVFPDDGGLGEVVGSPHTYSRGVTPAPYPTTVSGCSSDFDLQNGITLGGDHPLAPSGVKACCYSAVPPPACNTFTFPDPSVTLTIMDAFGNHFDMTLVNIGPNQYSGSTPLRPPFLGDDWSFLWQCDGDPAIMKLTFIPAGGTPFCADGGEAPPMPGFTYSPIACTYPFFIQQVSCGKPIGLPPNSSNGYTMIVH